MLGRRGNGVDVRGGVDGDDGEDGDDGDDGVASLDPYPGWMEPDQIGEFEVTVTAPSRRGTYDARLEIAGYNYETSVPVEIVVRK